MLKRIMSWAVRRQRTRSERSARRFSDSLRTRTIRVFTRPIRTVLSTSFMLAIIAMLYLLSQRAAETSALLDAETATVPQVLALFPPVYILVPALVVLVVFINAVRVWSGVRSDMGWDRYDHQR
jgi:hypothetical protein